MGHGFMAYSLSHKYFLYSLEFCNPAGPRFRSKSLDHKEAKGMHGMLLRNTVET